MEVTPVVLGPGEATRDAIARTFGVPRECVHVEGDGWGPNDRISVAIRQPLTVDHVDIHVVTGRIRCPECGGDADTCTCDSSTPPTKETPMPATTPMTAEQVEAQDLKTITLEEAADIAAQHEQAQRTADIAATRRNRAVASLLQRGHTTAQIAEAFGVTPGRIRQIAAAGRRAS